MTSLKSEPGSAEAAAKILLEKKIVILPTDTVYGFSGLAIAGGKKTGLDISIDKISTNYSFFFIISNKNTTTTNFTILTSNFLEVFI